MFLCNSMNVFFRHWKFMSRISSVLLAFFLVESSAFFHFVSLEKYKSSELSYRAVECAVCTKPTEKKPAHTSRTLCGRKSLTNFRLICFD